MKTALDVSLLFRRYSLQMLRNPIWLFVGFSTPILYLALFTPLLKHVAPNLGVHGGVLEIFLPGILCLLAFASGISMGFNTIFELQAGVVERFRVTPASRFAILVGPILSGLTMMLVFDAVVVAVGVGVGFKPHWLGLLALGVLLGLLASLMAAFSTATALVTKEINSFAAIINGLNLPILLLAGVLLPISIGPLWMRVLAHFNPLYYAVEASRALAVGSFGAPAVWQAFAVLVPLCALVVSWATRVFRKAVA
ncbi:MAG: ABC transporter permease [Acidimicrobiales bacterium]|jgi:ABC-2 type transport system permease protein